MKDTLYMAWQYLTHHRVKTVILVLSIALIIYLPIGLKVIVDQSSDSLTARAESTPLVIGAKGSPLELVLNTLYFKSETPEVMEYAEADRISGYEATAIPVYARFRADKQPLTTLNSVNSGSKRVGVWQYWENVYWARSRLNAWGPGRVDQ